MVQDDPALDTLLLPFEPGALGNLTWPDGPVLFLRARAGAALHEAPRDRLVCEQSFKPFADALADAGFAVTGEERERRFPLVLVLTPRQREESRALLARALQRAEPGGVVVAAAANNEGARSAESDLEQLAGEVRSESKNKCRVFWATRGEGNDEALIAAWAALDAPRTIAEGRFWSRPGIFAWDRIDTASALLARHLPANLVGRGADLGAGYGYLSAEVLTRCPGVRALDLYEAEARALDMARRNLRSENVAIEFHWHDVAKGLAAKGLPANGYDFIVSNPPFHQGRADLPQLGQAFITAAAKALVAGGRLWLVANRHLPYEDVLARHFRSARSVCEEQGFKVIEAVKGR